MDVRLQNLIVKKSKIFIPEKNSINSKCSNAVCTVTYRLNLSFLVHVLNLNSSGNEYTSNLENFHRFFLIHN